MWVFSLFAWLMLFLFPASSPLPCWEWDQAKGEQYGVHDDPAVMPTCPYK